MPHILRGSRTHPAPILSLKYSEPTSNWIFLANQYFFKSINDTFQIQTFLQISRTCLEALRCFSYSLLKKNLPPPKNVSNQPSWFVSEISFGPCAKKREIYSVNCLKRDGWILLENLGREYLRVIYCVRPRCRFSMINTKRGSECIWTRILFNAIRNCQKIFVIYYHFS